MRCAPARAFFRPGEPVRLRVTFERPTQAAVTASVYHLADPVASWQAAANGTDVVIEGAVLPEARRGYLVRIQAGAETAFTAFDVLERWTQAPRYGYLFDFSPTRSAEDMAKTLDHLLTLHVNGLQFYDWQYRHDTLLSPQEEFTDPLGRALSLKTVRGLIDGAHGRGMAAMPYTAIYAASPAFAAAHREWQLFDSAGQAVDFADGFLKLMSPRGPWQAHFVQECRRVLDALPFDGVHLDQYGEPTTGFDAGGQPVDLPAGFASIIENLRHEIGPEKSILFNLAHNWPAERIASTSLDFWYSELWPPDTSLARLWRIVRDNRRLNPRPAVLAVYVPPEHETTVVAAQSTILAAGGAHIAHGEHGTYLSDPYFPKAGKPGAGLAARLQQLADFAVAYEETLVFAEDVSNDWAGHILLNGSAPEPGSLIVRRAGNSLYVNLLRNGGAWDSALSPRQPLTGLRLTMPAAGLKGLRRAWCAAPESPLPCPLPSFELPPLADWLLVGLEYEDTPSCPT